MAGVGACDGLGGGDAIARPQRLSARLLEELDERRVKLGRPINTSAEAQLDHDRRSVTDAGLVAICRLVDSSAMRAAGARAANRPEPAPPAIRPEAAPAVLLRAGRRLDVLVYAEDVVGVVLRLDAREAVVVLAVGGADALLAFLHHEVDVRAPG